MTFYVRMTQHFYGPRDRHTLVEDDAGAPITFKTKEAAQAWIDAWHANPEPYREDHNEYGPPTLTIRQLRADARVTCDVGV